MYVLPSPLMLRYRCIPSHCQPVLWDGFGLAEGRAGGGLMEPLFCKRAQEWKGLRFGKGTAEGQGV